jgi:putative transposase
VKYAHWNQLGSQAIQDVVERIDRAYTLFFSNIKAGRRLTGRRRKASPPHFKKRIKYKSFTLKQAGYKLLQGNYIRIGKRIYRYFKPRDIEGNPKTLTIKRDALGDLYIIIVTDAETQIENVPRTGQSVGFDFGLKTFLTASDGNDVESPLFFKQGEITIRKASKELSHKKRGSHHRERARLNLAQKHRKIANQRNDFHWKLANRITDEYDFIFFEDLNLKGMQSLWGKKITDLGFYSFLQKVKYKAETKGKHVGFIGRFYPSSKTCSDCGFVFKDLELRQREWACSECGVIHDRDRNASINIARVGASTLGRGDVRPPSPVAIAA